MIVPLLLVLLSLALAAWGLQPGQSDLLLLALPTLIASLYLLARAALRPKAKPPNWIVADGSGVMLWRLRLKAKPPNWIVIDGSNVMHWADGKPRLSSLRAVIDHLTGLGFTPGVVFDANAGYKIGDRYQHDGALGKMLGLPADRVMVVAKGTPADPVLLTAARGLGARIVSNDRFRDWAEAHPEVTEPGHLVRGGFQGGKLWLDLD